MTINNLTIKGINDNGNRNTKFLKDVFCFDLYIIFNAGAYSCIFHINTS